MAEPYREHDPNVPDMPPHAVTHKGVRRAALWSYLGPIVGLFVGVGFALLYWASRPPTAGTTGQDVPRAIGTAGHTTPGGHSSTAPARTTREELERRGEAPLTELRAILEQKPHLARGRRVELRDVDVVDTSSTARFWVKDGGAKIAVIAPSGSPAVRNGQSIDLNGTVEADGHGSVRIRATHVTVHR